MEGWIKIHRQIRENWIWDNALYLKAWITILLTVNHDDKKTLIQGELVECKRGQSLLSLAGWAKIFGKKWTIQRVRTFFELLKNDEMIMTEGLRKTTRLTVCNYDVYQNQQQASNKQTTDKEQAENNKQEGEEYKKGKKKTTPKSYEFIDKIISCFVEEHGSYEIMTLGLERKMAGKLLAIYRKKYPKASSEDVLCGLRVYFKKCMAIDDPWLRDNMSLSIMVSKFNVISKILNNGKSKNNGAAKDQLANLIATKIGIDTGG
jgi:hypothetical protein